MSKEIKEMRVPSYKSGTNSFRECGSNPYWPRALVTTTMKVSNSAQLGEQELQKCPLSLTTNINDLSIGFKKA